MNGRPDSQYSETPNGFIGYQVFGEGPDIVYVTNWLTNIETIWKEPSARRFLERLGSMAPPNTVVDAARRRRRGSLMDQRHRCEGVLPAIQARTLVVARKQARFHRASFGKYLAEHIEGAIYRELDGADTFPFYAGDFGPVLDEIEEFVTGERTSVDANRMLATVLFTDIVGSTSMASQLGDDRWLDLVSTHDRIVADNLQRHRGVAIKTTGDGVLATFDGPHRAIRCAPP
ncbi:MAG: adenylate/guanylate cyclase domain-containing protein [Acidimicrobiia bacterium]